MHPSARLTTRQQNRIRHYALHAQASTLFDMLNGDQLAEEVDSLMPEHRHRHFPPLQTLSMFIVQALSADGSCQQVLDAALVERLLEGLEGGSANTGGYCKARARLPLSLISGLVVGSGRRISEQLSQPWHWRGRAVRLVDGTTVTLADTPANQAAFPQSNSQKPGLGFPRCRVVGLLCLGGGGLLGAGVGPCQGKGGDEQSLLRGLLGSLSQGDVLLGDAYYPSYFLLWQLARRGVDGLFEQQGARRRSSDFTRGESLGVRDHLVVLDKPKTRPEWMSVEQYQQAPDQLKVRELLIGDKIMVTTFLDAHLYPRKALKELYHRRWKVELDLRDIKITLGMQHLRCKTPAMAIKELWVYLLAYNLIRLIIAHSALWADCLPRQLSFKHTLQCWTAWQHQGRSLQQALTCTALLALVAQIRVANRPGRIEPRALKRRLKSYPLLTKPRTLARQDVIEYGHPEKQR